MLYTGAVTDVSVTPSGGFHSNDLSSSLSYAQAENAKYSYADVVMGRTTKKVSKRSGTGIPYSTPKDGRPVWSNSLRQSKQGPIENQACRLDYREAPTNIDLNKKDEYHPIKNTKKRQ